MLTRLFELKNSIGVFLQSEQKYSVFITQFSNSETQQSLAYLSDIFSILNITNESLQGKNSNYVRTFDIIRGCMAKISNYIRSVEQNIFFFSPNLSSNFGIISIKTHILIHLKRLKTDFESYFPGLKEFDTSLLNNPFDKNVEELPTFLQDEFLELINNTGLKCLYEKFL